MAKSITELLALKQSARAVPVRNISAIDWPGIVRGLMAGETLVFKSDCKYSLPKNTTELAEYLRKYGYTGPLKVRRPLAEVVILDPDVREDRPVVERSGRAQAKTNIAPQDKRGPGRPRKDNYTNGHAAH